MRIRTTRSAGFAASATLLAHWLAYRLTLSDPKTRAHVLEETGHGWLGWAWPVAVVGTMMMVTGLVMNRRREHAADAPTNAHRDVISLYLAGAGSFLFVEILERWLHTGSLEETAANLLTRNGGAPVLLGVILIALLSPLFLKIERVVARLLESIQREYEESVEPVYPRTGLLVVTSLHSGARWTRGPPAAGSDLIRARQ